MTASTLPPSLPPSLFQTLPRFRPAVLSTFALALALTAPARADLVTLGFDEVPTTAHQVNLGQRYASNGFEVTTDAIGGFIVWGDRSPGYLGSAALMAWGPVGSMASKDPAMISVQRSDGGLFNLASMDLANPLGRHPIAFQAFDAAGALLASYTIDSAQVTRQLTTFDFGDRFLGVARVSWYQGMSDSTVHEFDNLVLQALPPAGTVPEPGTLALAGLVLGVVALGTRRRTGDRVGERVGERAGPSC